MSLEATAKEAARSAPAVAGAYASSITLNQWIAVATGIYIVIQALYLLRKWYREELIFERQLAQYDKTGGVMPDA